MLDRTSIERVQMIMPQSLDEAYALVPLAREAHKESYFSDLPFEESAFLDICSFAIQKPGRYGGIYGTYDGVPAAFTLYMIRPLPGETRLRLTLIYAIYIRADLRGTKAGGFMWRRMLEVARVWGAVRNSKGMMFNVISGMAIEETSMLIHAHNGHHLGENFYMPLPEPPPLPPQLKVLDQIA